MEFSPVSVCFIPPVSKYSVQCPVLIQSPLTTVIVCLNSTIALIWQGFSYIIVRSDAWHSSEIGVDYDDAWEGEAEFELETVLSKATITTLKRTWLPL
jgi:hypothetical protein